MRAIIKFKKTKEYNNVGTLPKSNIKIIDRGKFGTSNSQIYMTSHFTGLVQALNVVPYTSGKI